MDYKIYRYYDNNINDCGWGCSYRNLQTILSCYKKYYNSDIIIPKIQDIVIYFGKNIKDKNLMNLWIEPYDIHNYLLKYFTGYNYLYVTKDSDITKILKTNIMVYLNTNSVYTNFEDIYNLITKHFTKTKLPIIIDNGIYSYCLTIYKEELFLIDPHTKTDRQITKKFLENKFWMIYFPKF